MIVDVKFSLAAQGKLISADHAYSLYSAVSGIVKAVHEEEGIGIHQITGVQTGDRGLLLNRSSNLVIRIDSDRIGSILPLAGKCLSIGSTCLQVGIPSVHVLTHALSLRSRLVTIKGFMEEKTFENALCKQLDELCISKSVVIDLGKRRTLRIHDKNVVGYEVFLSNLTEEESFRVQEAGLGGRRKMGCGIFLPCRRDPAVSPRNEIKGGE